MARKGQMKNSGRKKISLFDPPPPTPPRKGEGSERLLIFLGAFGSYFFGGITGS